MKFHAYNLGKDVYRCGHAVVYFCARQKHSQIHLQIKSKSIFLERSENFFVCQSRENEVRGLVPTVSLFKDCVCVCV